ncbi:MAG: XRE family transcriptional regulator [Bacteroidaceae bacterium]|nr:XRE family transcriptional regulator [Bacteroidaceae bacterium]
MINIGERIKTELERQERGVSWLAGKLGCSRMAIYRIFEKNSIDTHLLYRISKTLHHNFFNDLSEDVNNLSEEHREV